MTDQTFPEAMVEIVAEGIYGKMEFNGPPHLKKPAWQPGGNSLKQDEARGFARAALAALADAGYVIMPREVVDVLAWATPLAELATESHRLERVRCGYNDIRGTYKNGQTWVGIYQSEVDQIEQAREVCRAMRDAAMGGKG